MLLPPRARACYAANLLSHTQDCLQVAGIGLDDKLLNFNARRMFSGEKNSGGSVPHFTPKPG